MKKDKPSHCVQCNEPMIHGTDWDKFVPICTNPECPNYGLLQIGQEALDDLYKAEKSKI